MRRRDFISKVAIGGSILFASPFYLNSCSKGGDSSTDSPDSSNTGPITIDLTDSQFSALDTVGGYAYYGKYMIIRNGESSFVVLSKYCTHQNFTLEYLPDTNQIRCNNHGSMFTIDGAVINGPASRSLASYTATVSDNMLTIS
ncbi:QcrA and Rieske domain-containing protein [Mangrovibacterium lignilyticum]|uniref:QcrA and Rieske domain-containing protein n=1 Tax=Mangrovibacterium lignilyticum TaxID=2668052 RepID=UPI0013CF5237|nr:Rieske (2Fe-2S) protein [Mangrovibacterium lignilyticum]